ncbi:uncharacterized protein At1g51745-like isoform X2 [Apium graveolens]|uniref:uncharacterized protein At1g51745-like isoform X2 n=1 Tax=Apium graveolens TaxID=4045 RepID=UPI003D79CDD0
MGSSDTGTSTGVVDCSVGAIVWVRRRNGSWWPGKILGPEELSASHLMSPRSGTPVKLLGREDASVDWYNLEKSKRVKPFRCGEFDDCIDKAEASQGMPPKKREKYARREDAIIHALELEKLFLEKQYGKLGSSNYKSNIKKELATSAESMRQGNGKLAGPKSQQPSWILDLPHGGIISPHLHMQEVREERQLSADDDKADVLPRLRGLQDICLKTTSSKRGEEQTGEAGSAKRSKCVYQTKSSDSTDNTETHSEHMVVSASKLEENSNPPAALMKDNTSGSTEDTETDSDSSETDSLESDTDDEIDEISDESVEFRPKSMVKYEVEEEDESTSTEEQDDPATPSDISHPSNEDVSASAGVSKWQLKGKRNNRALTKRYVDLSNEKVSRGFDQGTKLKGRGSHADLVDSFGKKYGTRIGGYRSRGLDGITSNITSSEELAWNDQLMSRGYWGDSIEYTDPVFPGRRFGDRRKCMLVEVDLKVQSNYQREHVPMISLMSKLNGQAIVGHPIQVETLENGLTEALVTADDELNQEYDTSLQPVWRTARRTANCRVPRSHTSTMDGDEGSDHLQHVYEDRIIPLNKSNGGHFSNRTSLARKGSTYGSRASTDIKFKKPAKKAGIASNQKTRTLSSIATQQKPNNILKQGSNSHHVNGLIKPEMAPTAVACIPIKLVFSRLHEELNGRHQ